MAKCQPLTSEQRSHYASQSSKSAWDTGPQPTLDFLTQQTETVSVQKRMLAYVTNTRVVEIDGYILTKGCTIIANMDSMHKNPTQYPVHPESFIPERFMNSLKTMQSAANGKLAHRDHFNFGFGRRLCPGAYLVYTFYNKMIPCLPFIPFIGWCRTVQRICSSICYM